jgi:hypothetical protein
MNSFLSGAESDSPSPGEKADEEQGYENEEQDFRDSGGGSGYAAESEYGGYNRQD